MSLVIDLPGLRTRNQLNGKRRHWTAVNGERSAIKEHVGYALLAVDWKPVGKPSVDNPWEVKLVRLSVRIMDDDGVVSALKSVRDGFAAFVGVDDKHKHIIRYSYDQEPSKVLGVRIEVTARQLKIGEANGKRDATTT